MSAKAENRVYYWTVANLSRAGSQNTKTLSSTAYMLCVRPISADLDRFNSRLGDGVHSPRKG